MSVVNSFDENQNFWQVNPQLKLMGPFKELYRKDKSRNHKNSSTIMWAIAFRLDPNPENRYHKLSDESKAHNLAKDYLGDENFDWEKYNEEMHFFKDMVLTQAEKSLVVWNEIMSMRDREVKRFYKEAIKAKDIGLMIELDKLIEKTTKFYLDYKKVKDDFDKDQEIVKRGKGNRVQSLTDSNEL